MVPNVTSLPFIFPSPPSHFLCSLSVCQPLRDGGLQYGTVYCKAGDEAVGRGEEDEDESYITAQSKENEYIKIMKAAVEECFPSFVCWCVWKENL